MCVVYLYILDVCDFIIVERKKKCIQQFYFLAKTTGRRRDKGKGETTGIGKTKTFRGGRKATTGD